MPLLGTIAFTSPIESRAAGFPGWAWAWGANTNGRLGNGTTTSSSTPVAVNLSSGTAVTAIAAGGNFNEMKRRNC